MAWSSASGIVLRYELSGRGDRGLVLVHELGGSLESWDAVVPKLESTCRILRIDLRGAGLSEKVRTPFTIADHVRDLRALLPIAGFSSPVCVAGVAAGAAVAVGFALDQPAQASALILCPPALGVDADRRRYLDDRAERAAREGMRAVVDETLARSFPDVVIRDRVVYEAYRARFLANDPVCYGLSGRALAEAHVEPLVESLDCRCLLLAGAHDSLRPIDQVRALAGRVRHAQFEVLESGHLMPVQAPDALADRMLRFLAEVEREALA
jgi:3-oxoadipate enol-lactonase